MTVESDLRCDLCGCPLPPLPSEKEFAEEILGNPDYKFAWIMLDSEKILCKSCVLDVLNAADGFDLIDWPKEEAED